MKRETTTKNKKNLCISCAAWYKDCPREGHNNSREQLYASNVFLLQNYVCPVFAVNELKPDDDSFVMEKFVQCYSVSTRLTFADPFLPYIAFEIPHDSQ